MLLVPGRWIFRTMSSHEREPGSLLCAMPRKASAVLIACLYMNSYVGMRNPDPSSPSSDESSSKSSTSSETSQMAFASFFPGLTAGMATPSSLATGRAPGLKGAPDGPGDSVSSGSLPPSRVAIAAISPYALMVPRPPFWLSARFR